MLLFVNGTRYNENISITSGGVGSTTSSGRKDQGTAVAPRDAGEHGRAAGRSSVEAGETGRKQVCPGPGTGAWQRRPVLRRMVTRRPTEYPV